MNGFYKEFTNPKGKFGIWGIVVLVCLGVALMILPGVVLNNNNVSQPLPEPIVSHKAAVNYSLAELERSIAEQVSQILNQVQGAGQVSVNVTLESGPELDYTRNESASQTNIQERDNNGGTRLTTEANEKSEVVFSQKYDEALINKEIGPQIKGVLVVAEGASDPRIKAELGKAVQTMLDVPAHRVMVLPKEGR